MALPRHGRQAALGFGAETTWGTAVARTHWVRSMSSGLMLRDAKRPRPSLYDGTAGVSRKHNVAEQEAGGPIQWIFGFEGQGLLVAHALWGTPSTTGPVSGIYTHTYALGAAPPTGGLTIEEARGTDPSTNVSRVYEGGRLNSLEWAIQASGLVECSADVIAETHSGEATTGTITFTSNEVEALHHNLSTVSWNSATYADLTSARVKLDNGLARRYRLGARTTKEPSLSERKVSIEIELDYADATLLTGHTADTQSDLVLSCTGTGSRSIQWTLHNAFVDSLEDPVQNKGVLTQRVRFSGEADATDQGLTVVIANTQSTAQAA